MKKLDLFKALRKHRKLANKRAFNFEQNKVAKYLVWVVYAISFIYMLFFVVMNSLPI